MKLSARPRFENPFRPGAGHMPLYLAGRNEEQRDFQKLLEQKIILRNLVLTGLRGVGKTVLLETFKPLAIEEGWLWVGTDLSESASVSEESFAVRILTDLSVVTASHTVSVDDSEKLGFVKGTKRRDQPLGYSLLHEIFVSTPGLVADKIKRVLEFVWEQIAKDQRRGVIFAYDEAQNLSDHAQDNQFPLSMLLDVFQSIQRKNIPFMLALTGLPTLFPKLVQARTYAERMFHVVTLKPLDEPDSRDAILQPISDNECPIQFTEEAVETIYKISGGYPYFIQFVCRECFDIWTINSNVTVPVDEMVRKLDTDFFAGRWARATDRERDLLSVVSGLPNCDMEFTVAEIVRVSKKEMEKPFSNSHVSQLLNSLIEAGLVYRNRYGKYAFAVPLLGQFIRRQIGGEI
jgi:AAA+ ATPase superfamily predicted ATPase